MTSLQIRKKKSHHDNFMYRLNVSKKLFLKARQYGPAMYNAYKFPITNNSKDLIIKINLSLFTTVPIHIKKDGRSYEEDTSKNGNIQIAETIYMFGYVNKLCTLTRLS